MSVAARRVRDSSTHPVSVCPENTLNSIQGISYIIIHTFLDLVVVPY